MTAINQRNGVIDSAPELIVFADDWGRHPSSCQHLVRRLRGEYRVLWVNSIGTRKLRLDVHTFRRACEKLRGWGRGMTAADDSMSVFDVPMLPWFGNRSIRSANRWLVTRNIRRRMRALGFHNPVVLSTLPFVGWLLGDVGQSRTIYYCTDDYSQWPNADRDALEFSEQAMLRRADLVLAVSEHLMQRCGAAKRCEYFPHAVDFSHFSKVRTSEVPPELARLPGPRIGFFGLVYEKLDFVLLEKIAKQFPDASLVLIGRVDSRPDSLADLPNVHLLGPKPYEELPRWIGGLDVLLMPYVLDDMILRSNPLKMRECLATGIPTVSVDVPEARRFVPHIRVAASHDEFLAAVRNSLSEGDDAGKAAARQQVVASETWDARARQLSDYIQSLQSLVPIAC